MPLPRLALTVAETAASLGVSQRSIYRLIDRGELPTVKVGKRRLVRVEDLEKLLEAAS